MRRRGQVEESIESTREWLNRKASTKGKMVQSQSDRQVRVSRRPASTCASLFLLLPRMDRRF